jgi:hypothetical protein
MTDNSLDNGSHGDHIGNSSNISGTAIIVGKGIHIEKGGVVVNPSDDNNTKSLSYTKKEINSINHNKCSLESKPFLSVLIMYVC